MNDDLNFSPMSLDLTSNPEPALMPVVPIFQTSCVPVQSEKVYIQQPKNDQKQPEDPTPKPTCAPFLYTNFMTQRLEMSYKNARRYETVANGYVTTVTICTYDQYFQREDDIRLVFRFNDATQKVILIPISDLVGSKIENAFRQQGNIILAYSVNKELFHMALANYISSITKNAPTEHHIYHSGWFNLKDAPRYRLIAEGETVHIPSAYSQRHLQCSSSEPLSAFRAYAGLSSIFKDKKKFLFLSLLLHNSICYSLLEYVHTEFPLPISISCTETLSRSLIPYFLQQFNREKLSIHASLSQKNTEMERVLYEAKDETIIIADDAESFRTFDALVEKIKQNLPMTKCAKTGSLEFRCQSNIVFLSTRAPFHYSSDDMFFFDIEEEDVNLIEYQQLLANELIISNHMGHFIAFCERQSKDLIETIRKRIAEHLERGSELSLLERKTFISLMTTADIIELYTQSLGLSFTKMFSSDKGSFAEVILSLIESSSSTSDAEELAAMFKETVLAMSARNAFNLIGRRSGDALNAPYDPCRANVFVDTNFVYFTRTVMVNNIRPNFSYDVPVIQIQRALFELNLLKKHSGRGLDTKTRFRMPDGDMKTLHAVTVSREAFDGCGTLNPFSGL